MIFHYIDRSKFFYLQAVTLEPVSGSEITPCIKIDKPLGP